MSFIEQTDKFIVGLSQFSKIARKLCQFLQPAILCPILWFLVEHCLSVSSTTYPTFRTMLRYKKFQQRARKVRPPLCNRQTKASTGQTVGGIALKKVNGPELSSRRTTFVSVKVGFHAPNWLWPTFIAFQLRRQSAPRLLNVLVTVPVHLRCVTTATATHNTHPSR